QVALSLVLTDLEGIVADQGISEGVPAPEIMRLTPAQEEDIAKQEFEDMKGVTKIQGEDSSGTAGFGSLWKYEPHTVLTLIVALAQPKSQDAADLLEAAQLAEDDLTVNGSNRMLEHLLANPTVSGNVMGMTLLWTAEPSIGFEEEDILTLSALEKLYPELWPERIKAVREAKEDAEAAAEMALQINTERYNADLEKSKRDVRLLVEDSETGGKSILSENPWDFSMRKRRADYEATRAERIASGELQIDEDILGLLGSVDSPDPKP
ncbi:hypothetical protein T484DRAFT_1962596, partial [Baffinella frigidus]